MQIPKETIRTRILVAAEEAFYYHGYQHTSLRRIAESAGITAGNIYHYFENKEALFYAVVQPALEEIKEFIFVLGHQKQEWNYGTIQVFAKNITDRFLANEKKFIILLKEEPLSPNIYMQENIEKMLYQCLVHEFLPQFPEEMRDYLIIELIAKSFQLSIIKIFTKYEGNRQQLEKRLTRILFIYLFSSLHQKKLEDLSASSQENLAAGE